MSMSRRDYELLAAVVASSGSRFTSNTAHAGFASDLADAIEWTNGRFVRERFLTACQPKWTVGTTHAAAWERVAAS